jgi:plasmid stability protein
MSKLITIRNVPEETHRELVRRASLAGQSLQQYLLREVNSLASKPDVAVLMAQVQARKRAMPNQTTVEKILEYRDLDRR